MGTGWASVDNAGTNNPIDTQAYSFIINKQFKGNNNLLSLRPTQFIKMKLFFHRQHIGGKQQITKYKLFF